MINGLPTQAVEQLAFVAVGRRPRILRQEGLGHTIGVLALLAALFSARMQRQKRATPRRGRIFDYRYCLEVSHGARAAITSRVATCRSSGGRFIARHN
jgi:hypothetical protein